MPRSWGRRRQPRATLARYGAAASPLVALAPIPGATAAAAVTAAGAQLGQPPLSSLRNDVERSLRKSPSSYLVIVDDIDRLQPDELLMLFKVIRLVGRLPRIHYLLSFDERTIIDVLVGSPVATTVQRVLAYIEKIVQVRVDLPPLHPADVDELVVDAFGAALSSARMAMNEADQDRFSHVYTDILRPRLDQPRQILRLFGQVQQALPLVHGEVDVVDLVVLTYLRTTYPALFGRLPQLGSRLTSSVESALEARRTSAERRREGWVELLRDADVPTTETEDVLELLGELFPGVASSTGARGFDDGGLRLGRRIGSPEYFDRYFQLGVPPDDVPDSQVAEAVRDLAGNELGTQSVSRLADQVRLRPGLVLHKMRVCVANCRRQPGDWRSAVPSGSS